MKIEFVNHSSVIYKYQSVVLLTDPWIDGDVFQEGWRHIAETKFKYENFDTITHIWFSHEHPDHFFPDNIKKIPSEFRAKITVLYQFTVDKKVVDYCTKLGFKKVIELAPYEWVKLASDFSIVCNTLWDDSWLGIKTDRTTVLNTNDCFIYDPIIAEPIKKCIGKIDLLMTQFSYAQYEGNKSQIEERRKAAKKKLTHVDVQISVFKPKYLLPFASFIWFCHEENYFTNDASNTIWDIEDIYSKRSVIPIVLFPGDKWEVDSEHDNSMALGKWKEAYELTEEPHKLNRTRSVNVNEVLENGIRFLKKLKEKGYSKMIKPNCNLTCYLYDIDAYVFLSKNKVELLESKKTHDCLITSETLNYCFKFDWGFNTTHVNARVQFLSDKAFTDFLQFEVAASFMNHGTKPPYLMNRVIAKIKKIVGK